MGLNRGQSYRGNRIAAPSVTGGQLAVTVTVTGGQGGVPPFSCLWLPPKGWGALRIKFKFRGPTFKMTPITPYNPI